MQKIEYKAGNHTGSHVSKATKEQRFLRMDIIAPLFKRGWSYRAMREEVMARLDLKSLSLRTVKQDVDALLKEWREERIENTDYALQLELNRIDDLIKEAWEAWEKSKEDYQKLKGKQQAIPAIDGEGGEDNKSVIVTKLEQTKEDMRSCGDPRYLELINKLLQERRKLLGLYAPEKLDHTGELSFTNFLMQTGQIEDTEHYSTT